MVRFGMVSEARGLLKNEMAGVKINLEPAVFRRTCRDGWIVTI